MKEGRKELKHPGKCKLLDRRPGSIKRLVIMTRIGNGKIPTGLRRHPSPSVGWRIKQQLLWETPCIKMHRFSPAKKCHFPWSTWCSEGVRRDTTKAESCTMESWAEKSSISGLPDWVVRELQSLLWMCHSAEDSANQDRTCILMFCGHRKYSVVRSRWQCARSKRGSETDGTSPTRRYPWWV